MILSGTLADLNAFLAEPTNIQYVADPSITGKQQPDFLLLGLDGTSSTLLGSSKINVTPQTPTVDLEVSVSSTASHVASGNPFAWTVTLTNNDSVAVNSDATGVQVSTVIPLGMNLISSTVTSGTAVGPTWFLTEALAPGESATMTLVASVENANGAIAPVSYVQAVTEQDIDSTPGTRDIAEDDADQVVLTVAPRIDNRSPISTTPSSSRPSVNVDGDTLIAVGTAGDDVVLFEVGDTTHRLNISGHRFEFDANAVTSINIGASSGNDSVRIIGSGENESGWINGERSELRGPNYTVRTFSFDETSIDGGTGNDQLQVFGSDQNDELTISPKISRLDTPTNRYYLSNLDRVDFFGRHGDDSATFYGSGSTDTYVALENQDQFRTANQLFTAKGFTSIDVHSGGGHDRGILYDTSDDDNLVGTPNSTSLSNDGDRTRNVFSYVDVLAITSNGGADRASLLGAPGQPDRFLSAPNFSELIGHDYRVRVEDFEIDSAHSSDGLDEAIFTQLTSLDTFFASGPTASASGSRNDTAEGFSAVTAEIAANESPTATIESLDFVLRNISDWIE